MVLAMQQATSNNLEYKVQLNYGYLFQYFFAGVIAMITRNTYECTLGNNPKDIGNRWH